MERKVVMVAFALDLFLALVSASSMTAQQTGFVSRTVDVEGVAYAYQVFVPSDWSPERKWPVILFLHGAGQRGSDGTRQTDAGLPARLRQTPDFPAIVVMPQCRRGAWWGEPAMETMVWRALDETMNALNGDPDRVTLTGLSMGGYGTWAFGYKYPDKFAALAPVCGGVVSGRAFATPDWHPFARAPEDPYAETASKLTRVPIWAFHGEADPVVPVSESRKLTAAVKAAGGNVRYTEYPGVRHNSWDRAYGEDGLMEWLLSQTKQPTR